MKISVPRTKKDISNQGPSACFFRFFTAQWRHIYSIGYENDDH